MGEGWIGVDLDGTLAEYVRWQGVEYIGEPIPLMVDRVKKWLEDGKDVRIFTVRVHKNQDAKKIASAKYWIESWCMKHIGQMLPVTNEKDYGMIELWDDRCIQVIPNTGKRANGSDDTEYEREYVSRAMHGEPT